MPTAIKYLVQWRVAGRWEDAGWTENDKPLRFTSYTDGCRAIDEFIADAAKAGLDYNLTDFRAVPAPE